MRHNDTAEVAGQLAPVWGPVLFAEPVEAGCTGQMFIRASAIASRVYSATPAASEPIFVVARAGGPAATLSLQSELSPEGECKDVELTTPVFPVDVVSDEDLGITFPVAVPFRIAPAPE